MPVSWSSAFRSSGKLETCFNKLGFNTTVTQVSAGKLIGQFSCKLQSGIVFLHIESNKALVICGDCKPQFITIAVETSANREYTKVQGHTLPLSSIAGYGIQKSEIFYSVSPGSSMYFAILPSIAFQGLSYQLSGEHVIERLRTTNLMQVDESTFLKLHRACQHWTHEPSALPQSEVSPEDIMVYFHNILETNSSYHRTSNYCKPIVREFIRLCLEDSPRRPITVGDMTSKLFTSKTSLSSQIKIATGLTPLQFMRFVRLEQVRRNLLLSEGQANVGDLACQYGFSSRGHFAKQYQDLFGEKPTETLTKLLL